MLPQTAHSPTKSTNEVSKVFPFHCRQPQVGKITQAAHCSGVATSSSWPQCRKAAETGLGPVVPGRGRPGSRLMSDYVSLAEEEISPLETSPRCSRTSAQKGSFKEGILKKWKKEKKTRGQMKLASPNREKR